jgi:hypothetical protein
MHTHTLENWTHEHVFLGERHEQNERRTWFVVALTVVMMVGEITAGSFFGSDRLPRGNRGCVPWASRQSHQRLSVARQS